MVALFVSEGGLPQHTAADGQVARLVDHTVSGGEQGGDGGAPCLWQYLKISYLLTCVGR